MARPATGKTKLRNIRVPDDLWDAAMAEAKAEGRTLTDVIVSDLHRYVNRRHRENTASQQGESDVPEADAEGNENTC